MPWDDDADDLLAEHPDTVAATAHRLRAVLLDAHPQLEERVRRGWHSINYRDPAAGFVCALFPTGEGVQLVFEHGARLPDPEQRLLGSGKQVRTLAFTDPADVDPAVVGTFLDHAVELGAGLRAR
ncbi:DUF1801 domain-containing protein [Geodermatophilus sabuli]|uniref:YdhG-like domain-containing protein n=1 Tax=Geodermatophilus sabuli TaxID=1564158 RepID=A0A285EKA2_9ACTN|nr:DUF1801 domain-containing protein [Geodermatophilus sabuli]MBB3086937.1 hypothetical protein [Geodermatophilus sabuli]SNX99283.1 protein of unknown function (DU1801) [Geodermatophilus sabuli]